MNNELLYNQLYERTKEFGRTQFIKEIMRLERENKHLKIQLAVKEEMVKIKDETIAKLLKENKELHNKLDKTIDYNKQIIKDTKAFYRPTSDTIYSGDCLIDIAGQNLKILKDGDVDE